MEVVAPLIKKKKNLGKKNLPGQKWGKRGGGKK